MNGLSGLLGLSPGQQAYNNYMQTMQERQYAAMHGVGMVSVMDSGMQTGEAAQQRDQVSTNPLLLLED